MIIIDNPIKLKAKLVCTEDRTKLVVTETSTTLDQLTSDKFMSYEVGMESTSSSTMLWGDHNKQLRKLSFKMGRVLNNVVAD